MAREIGRDHPRDAEAERRRAAGARDRDDFGQADYSRDYAYDPERRAGYRADDDLRSGSEDYGQAEYSRDYGYDEARRAPYRRFTRDDPGPAPQQRSWMDRAGDFFSPNREPDREARPHRRGPSDRVLWAVIVERLEDERRLDLSDLEVIVEDAEVTLNGTVRHKDDKRRIEDVADIRGVRHVQNNLRVRGHTPWAFI